MTNLKNSFFSKTTEARNIGPLLFSGNTDFLRVPGLPPSGWRFWEDWKKGGSPESNCRPGEAARPGYTGRSPRTHTPKPCGACLSQKSSGDFGEASDLKWNSFHSRLLPNPQVEISDPVFSTRPSPGPEWQSVWNKTERYRPVRIPIFPAGLAGYFSKVRLSCAGLKAKGPWHFRLPPGPEGRRG